MQQMLQAFLQAVIFLFLCPISAFVPYTPKLKRVFKDPSNSQMMQVEWFEGGDTYGIDLKMIFQIQVLLAYDMQEVWMVSEMVAWDVEN